jgi:rhodanese-related sulfurtransferase
VTTCLLFLVTLTPDRLRPLISLQFPSVEWLERSTLAEWLERDPTSVPLLLDTRSPEEFAVSRLPGAVRVDPDHPDLDALELEVARPVVLYCSVGYRSAAIAAELEARGIDEVYNLRGGIFAWANEGRTVVRNEEPVRVVHPYDALWGRLLHPDLRQSEPDEPK